MDEKKKETFQDKLEQYEEDTEAVVEPIIEPSPSVDPDIPGNPENL